MNKFDDIRPFTDSEIPAAMRRIAESPQFPLLAQYVYPGEDIGRIKEMLLQFQNVYDFQHEVMRCVNEQVIARSTTSFTFDGFDVLDPQKRYLFVSNHRDIMLDACLLQYVLWQCGHETTEITFGANLMSSPLVIDIGKSNKMFRVERGGSPREFYRSSVHLSEYIRYCITEKHQSVWIAQRNGRTKDGIDQTDQKYLPAVGIDRLELCPGELGSRTPANYYPQENGIHYYVAEILLNKCPDTEAAERHYHRNTAGNDRTDQRRIEELFEHHIL